MNPFIRVPTKGEGGYVLVNMMQITSVFLTQNDSRANVKMLYDANPIRSTATMEEMEVLMGLTPPEAEQSEPDPLLVEEQPSTGRKKKC